MASRQVAALTSRGGQISSEIAMPSPAASSKATESTCPAEPIALSTCPGSRLSAGVLYLVRPSGNSTLFCTRASAPRREVSAAGARAAIRTTAVTTATATNRAAARAPSRAANIAASTGTASQAVDLRSQAAPRAIPEPVIPLMRAAGMARARASRISASTGGSVVITARLSASTGEASATAVASHASRRHARQPRWGTAIRNAAASGTTVPTAIHTPEFPASPPSPAALGSPNSVINGR
jgi:hypothetical protein